jgi:hypothetical protein
MLGLIAAGAQAALGLGQTIAGLARRKPPLPEYDIPQEIYQNMSDAEYQSFIGLPDVQKQQFIEESKRAGATALARSSDRKGGLGLVSGIAQQERDDARMLMTEDATQRLKNLHTFWGMRETMAGEKRLKQQVKRENIMQRRDERAQMIGAGLQNIMGATGTGAAIDTYTEGGLFSSLSGRGGASVNKLNTFNPSATVPQNSLSAILNQ